MSTSATDIVKDGVVDAFDNATRYGRGGLIWPPVHQLDPWIQCGDFRYCSVQSIGSFKGSAVGVGH